MPLSCDKNASKMSLAGIDVVVAAYFNELELVTKRTLLRNTTGLEAGAYVIGSGPSSDSAPFPADGLLKLSLWWPQVWGGSYGTTALQPYALLGGARLGRAIGRDDVVECDSRAPMILECIQWSPLPNSRTTRSPDWMGYTNAMAIPLKFWEQLSSMAVSQSGRTAWKSSLRRTVFTGYVRVCVNKTVLQLVNATHDYILVERIRKETG
ncbi:hypothetical protein EI94DRAFT_1809996 [Lactarius quietus]|nr:hypothetical protein EI94DRAFT_1809996 [Lactarius quietus]